jgi:hypothetical protein
MLTPDRPEELANARPTPALLAAQQNARRARVANTTRYCDETAWRFGHPTRLCERSPGFGVHGDADDRVAANADRIPRSGRRLTSGEVRTTARTAF